MPFLWHLLTSCGKHKAFLISSVGDVSFTLTKIRANFFDSALFFIWQKRSKNIYLIYIFKKWTRFLGSNKLHYKKREILRVHWFFHSATLRDAIENMATAFAFFLFNQVPRSAAAGGTQPRNCYGVKRMVLNYTELHFLSTHHGQTPCDYGHPIPTALWALQGFSLPEAHNAWSLDFSSPPSLLAD